MLLCLVLAPHPGSSSLVDGAPAVCSASAGGCVVSHVQPWGRRSSLEAALRSLRTQAEVQDLQAGGKKLLSAWRGLAASGCHWHRTVIVAHGEEAGRGNMNFNKPEPFLAKIPCKMRFVRDPTVESSSVP